MKCGCAKPLALARICTCILALRRTPLERSHSANLDRVGSGTCIAGLWGSDMHLDKGIGPDWFSGGRAGDALLIRWKSYQMGSEREGSIAFPSLTFTGYGERHGANMTCQRLNCICTVHDLLHCYQGIIGISAG